MKEDIEQIKERNRKVEADKAWETSRTRRLLIAIMTYIIMVVFLILIDVQHPWLNALIPTAGFVLSTLSLSYFKKIWMKKWYGKK